MKAFETGEAYEKLHLKFQKLPDAKDQTIRTLKRELEDTRRQVITVRKNWLQVIEDMEKEQKRAVSKLMTILKAMEIRALKAERERDEALDKLARKRQVHDQTLIELEEVQGKNQKLLAQSNHDYENSGISSALKPNHKKITNNREKTGRKPGGQPGHEGHGRKKHTPTNRIHIPAPEKYTGSPDFKPAGRTISRQVVNIHVSVTVDEYDTPEFRNVNTGQRVHADFPDGVIDDVNYGGSVKAFAFLLNNHCCVSIDKTREFLSDLTDGELQISKGMINRLCRQFSSRTEAAQKKSFADLLISPVMNTDLTTARLNGKNIYVAICAKECLVHILRYLKDSMDNEPNLEWNKLMRELIREMIHYRNSLDDDAPLDPDEVKKYEARYSETLAKALEEYEDEPPSEYYIEGYNLYKRLGEYMESHLLFLHDKRVPADNNLAERLGRVFKRKLKQVMTFRNFDSISYLCNCLGMIALLCAQDQNLYASTASIFD